MFEEERWPKRPSLPLALGGFGALLIAMRLTLSILEPTTAFFWGTALPFKLWIAGVLGLMILGLLWDAKSHHPAVAVFTAGLFGALGWGLGLSSLGAQAQATTLLERTPVSALQLRVVHEPSQTARGYWFLANAYREERLLGNVWVSADERFELGQTVNGEGRFEPVERDAWGIASTMQGVVGTITLLSIRSVRQASFPLAPLQALRSFFLNGIEPAHDQGRALIAGAALGQRDALKTFGLDETFSRVGLAHLVAVSGFHSALVTTLAGRAFLRFAWPKTLRIFALFGLGGLYCLLCGSPLSALRAFAMATSAQGADLFGRRAYGLNALGLAGTGFVLLDPSCAGDVGFVLSASCVVALGLFSRWASHGLKLITTPKNLKKHSFGKRGALRRALQNAQQSFAASFVCSLVSFPFVAASFSSFSVVGPFASLVITPLFEPWLVLALGAALLGWIPWFGRLLVSVVAGLAQAILRPLEFLGAFPWSEQPVELVEPWATLIGVGIIALLYVLWPHPRPFVLKGLVGAGLVLGTLTAIAGMWLQGAQVVVLDVGQGDAILIQEGPHALLVDTGPDEAIALALARHKVRSLDAILLTHQHSDHAGGLESLEGSVAVGEILVPWGQITALGEGVEPAAQALGAPIKEVYPGDKLCLGGFTLTMLWPETPEDGDQNEESLVCSLSYAHDHEELRGLLTGDAESDVLQALIDQKRVGDIDFLKVGHHGSKVSLTEAEAKALDPELAVASAGEGNRYGHPSQECVDTLKRAGSTVFCTIEAGDVVIEPAPLGPRVHTQNVCEPR